MDYINNFLNGVTDAAILVLLAMAYVVLALGGYAGIIYSVLWTIHEIDRNKPKQ